MNDDRSLSFCVLALEVGKGGILNCFICSPLHFHPCTSPKHIFDILPFLFSWQVASSACHPLYSGSKSARAIQHSFQTWKVLQETASRAYTKGVSSEVRLILFNEATPKADETKRIFCAKNEGCGCAVQVQQPSLRFIQ